MPTAIAKRVTSETPVPDSRTLLNLLLQAQSAPALSAGVLADFLEEEWYASAQWAIALLRWKNAQVLNFGWHTQEGPRAVKWDMNWRSGTPTVNVREPIPNTRWCLRAYGVPITDWCLVGSPAAVRVRIAYGRVDVLSPIISPTTFLMAMANGGVPANGAIQPPGTPYHPPTQRNLSPPTTEPKEKQS